MSLADLKINIHGRNDGNQIVEKEYPVFENAVRRVKSTKGMSSTNSVQIVFDSFATALFFDEIGWGSGHTDENVMQVGLILGNYYRDTSNETSITWGDVISIIPANTDLVRTSSREIKITDAAWREMFEKASELRAENLHVLGWYCKRPGYADTKLSHENLKIHREVFSGNYHFAIIVNPNQERWSVYYGVNGDDCTGELVFDKSLEAQYGKPQIEIKHISIGSESQSRQDETVIHLISGVQRPIDRVATRQQSVAHVQQPEPQAPTVLTEQRTSMTLGQHIGQIVDTIISFFSLKSKKNKRKSTPKISIKGRNTREQKSIFRYFSYSSDNGLFEHPNSIYKINIDDITKIVHRKREKGDAGAWFGEIDSLSNNMKLVVRGHHDPNVNAKIIFSPNTDNREIVHMVGTAFRSNPNLRYTVIINDSNPQELEVVFLQYSREMMV